MNPSHPRVDAIVIEAQAAIEAAESSDDLEALRVRYLGRQGVLTQLLRSLGALPAEERPIVGAAANAAKRALEAALDSRLAMAVVRETRAQRERDRLDLTLPGEPHRLGTRHPISLVRNKAIRIFERLGFTIAEGPEIENDWHNFTALNLAENHPARDMQDTFYVHNNPDWLLRTHTSSVQVRAMEEGKLPIRIICPGRVYRNETISARAHCFFHQIEGLYIAENVSFADLKQTLYYFVQEMFGKDFRVRFRPSYFPFTEPSAEMDISCLICGGEGCNVCKHTGWVEILGCGMVHPQILENCGIDSKKYTGYAFGIGIERLTMLKYQIKDLRLFSENASAS